MQWVLKQKGFTIVELLIVVVVIAILAAITIVAYRGIQNNAHDAAVQSDLSSNGKLLLRRVAETGVYPVSFDTIGLKASKGSYLLSRNNFYICVNATTGRFALSGVSVSGKGFQNVDGNITQSASQLWGADTCNLIGSGVMAGAYSSTGATWQSWVNG